MSSLQLTRSSFGEVVTVPLVPSGSAVPVTLDNRAEYVQAYVRYVLDVAVNDPFMAFDEGFRRVCDGKVLVSLGSYIVILIWSASTMYNDVCACRVCEYIS